MGEMSVARPGLTPDTYWPSRDHRCLLQPPKTAEEGWGLRGGRMWLAVNAEL